MVCLKNGGPHVVSHNCSTSCLLLPKARLAMIMAKKASSSSRDIVHKNVSSFSLRASLNVLHCVPSRPVSVPAAGSVGLLSDVAARLRF